MKMTSCPQYHASSETEGIVSFFTPRSCSGALYAKERTDEGNSQRKKLFQILFILIELRSVYI